MAAIRDRTKAYYLDNAAEDGPISVAQQQLQELLRRQLQTRRISVKTALDQSREFAPAVVFKPLASEVEGLHTFKQYQIEEKKYSHVDQFRELGLTSEEIELKLSSEGMESSLPKKRKFKVEPAAQQKRMEALNQKISTREKLLRKPLKFTGAHRMSRHAMEVENSLFRDRGNPLTHLTEENSQYHMVYPSRVIPDIVSHTSSSGSNLCPDPADSDHGEGLEEVIPLPPQVIERNRLSEAEIRSLPRFTNYSPGKPSKVLFLKNLHHKVTEDDLKAVFGSLEICKQELPAIRVMTGRMKGQAFVGFQTVDNASIGLKAINGFIMKEKPVIISYGHENKTKSS